MDQDFTILVRAGDDSTERFVASYMEVGLSLDECEQLRNASGGGQGNDVAQLANELVKGITCSSCPHA